MDILCQHSHLYCQSQRKTQIEECNLYLNYLSCTNCVVTSLVRFHFYCRLVNESWTFWSHFNPGNFCDGIESWWDQAMESSVDRETGLFSSPSTWVHKHIQMWVKYKCETSSKWDECLFAIKVVYMCSGIWIRNVVKNYLLFRLTGSDCPLLQHRHGWA